MVKEFLTLGVDDSSFSFSDSSVRVVAALLRGLRLERVDSFFVEKDGFDSSEKIVSLLSRSCFKHLHCLFLQGVALAGFNVVNPFFIFDRTGKPVIIVSDKQPFPDRMVKALVSLGLNSQARIVEKLPVPERVGDVWFQCVGADRDFCLDLLARTSVNGKFPESLRVARLIAKGLSDDD